MTATAEQNRIGQNQIGQSRPEPMTEDTAFLITDAGIEALRLADLDTPVFGAQEAADAVSDTCAG